MADFLSMKFDTYPFEGSWAETFGCPEKNFKMCIWGNSGNGKTDFCVQFVKYVCRFGKVLYNSFEEGKSATLQLAFLRHNMIEVKGKVILGDRMSFDQLLESLAHRNSPRIVVIDSIDYMEFTKKQYQELTERFPHKAFIFISWSQGKQPLTSAGRAIKYMSDIKVYVDTYNAYPQCRFGGNEVFNIWDKYKLQPKNQKTDAEQPDLFTPQPPLHGNQ